MHQICPNICKNINHPSPLQWAPPLEIFMFVVFYVRGFFFRVRICSRDFSTRIDDDAATGPWLGLCDGQGVESGWSLSTGHSRCCGVLACNVVSTLRALPKQLIALVCHLLTACNLCGYMHNTTCSAHVCRYPACSDKRTWCVHVVCCIAGTRRV